jgi:hypothetical protein
MTTFIVELGDVAITVREKMRRRVAKLRQIAVEPSPHDAVRDPGLTESWQRSHAGRASAQ